MRPAAILFLFFLSCSGQKNIPEPPIESICFGSYGGFSGRVTSYCLSASGELTKQEADSSIRLDTVAIDSMNIIIMKARDLKSYSYNTPANMNDFLEIKRKDSGQKFVWGRGSSEVDKRVIELYNRLITLTR
jgi:hypothetical protein